MNCLCCFSTASLSVRRLAEGIVRHSEAEVSNVVRVSEGPVDDVINYVQFGPHAVLG